jgi:hypothetical protein
MSGAPKDYIEVKDRIVEFYKRFPEGSLQGEWTPAQVGEETLIVYTARAYRTANDERPGVGHASEPFPGKTNFTRGSELSNAETSAWGRAISSLGIAAHRGIASAQDVRASQARATTSGEQPGVVPSANGGRGQTSADGELASEKQIKMLHAKAKAAKLTPDEFLQHVFTVMEAGPPPEGDSGQLVEKALARLPKAKVNDLVAAIEGGKGADDLPF